MGKTVHFEINKVTQTFAQVLRDLAENHRQIKSGESRSLSDAQANLLNTMIGQYGDAGVEFEQSHGHDNNWSRQDLPKRMSPEIYLGLRKIAAYLDTLAKNARDGDLKHLNIKTDEDLEGAIRKFMKDDKEATKAKAFVKNFYLSDNGNLKYPTLDELKARSDVFGDWLKTKCKEIRAARPAGSAQSASSSAAAHAPASEPIYGKGPAPKETSEYAAAPAPEQIYGQAMVMNYNGADQEPIYEAVDSPLK